MIVSKEQAVAIGNAADEAWCEYVQVISHRGGSITVILTDDEAKVRDKFLVDERGSIYKH